MYRLHHLFPFRRLHKHIKHDLPVLEVPYPNDRRWIDHPRSYKINWILIFNFNNNGLKHSSVNTIFSPTIFFFMSLLEIRIVYLKNVRWILFVYWLVFFFSSHIIGAKVIFLNKLLRFQLITHHENFSCIRSNGYN